MPNSKRKCGHCKEYKPSSLPTSYARGAQWFCSTECVINQGRLNLKNLEKKSNRKAKRELNESDRTWHVKRTQSKCNERVRLRDAGKPCISCGAENYKITAGHYKTAGGNPELRFNTKNIHGQCWYNCNKMKSGNIAEYRPRLVERYGVELVEYLEGPHEPKNYTIDDLKRLYRWFDYRVKQMKSKT